MLDTTNRVFAVRACRKDESRTFKLSKAKEEQKAAIALSGKKLLDPLRKCTVEIWEKDIRYKVNGFWVAEAKTMCFDVNEGEAQNYFNQSTLKENEE